MFENEKKNKEKKTPSFDLGINGFFNRLRPSKPEKAKQKEIREKKKESRQ